LPAIAQQAHIIKAEGDKYTLSFSAFTINLLFCIIEGIESVSQLVTFIKTFSQAKELDWALRYHRCGQTTAKGAV